MDRQLEKRLSDRAVAIGREGNVAAAGELLELLQSSSANARRLAASALGKLAWMGVDQAAAVAALAPVARRDPHTQTRQYAIKALKAYGAAAQGCVSDLRDTVGNSAEKDYIRRGLFGFHAGTDERSEVSQVEGGRPECAPEVDSVLQARTRGGMA